MKLVNIAIDGPVASGKTSVARELAKKIKYCYIDTGAMYRAITWKALKNKLDMNNEDILCKMALETEISLKSSDKNNSGYIVFVDGVDITEYMTDPDVRRNVSPLSAVKGVREILVSQQKKMALDKGVIMAGRDIGTVVLPEAELKIFLTASPEERARRRHLELIDKGENITFEKVLQEVKKRDVQDMSRENSPLIKARDAIELDCTSKSLEEVVREIIILLRKKVD